MCVVSMPVWTCAIMAQLAHRPTAMTVVAIVLWCFAIRLPSKDCVKTVMMQGGALLLQQ